MALTLPFDDAAPRVLTVTELTRRVQGLLANLGRVAVRGEISRVLTAASGHVYFDLKDLDSKIACTIWKSQVAHAARFELAEGVAVIAHGKLDVYGPRGTYSLIVQRLEQEGVGALLVEFERLKQELAAKGWFDRKRPLPAMPARIGVVTSRDGAALQDFLRTRTLRWPLYPLVLAHSPVQGKTAAAEIARAIERLNRTDVDVIALVRGGGSLEDLWCFNELPVLEAICNSRVPVVTGVGHEVDTTLADFVADHRAHTPTDAAQTLIPERAALFERLQRAGNQLFEAIDGRLEERERRLGDAARARVLTEPEALLVARDGTLAHLAARMTSSLDGKLRSTDARVQTAHRRLEASSPRVRVEELERRLSEARGRLAPALARLVERRERRFAVAAGKLDALSPLEILGRGYSITTRASGEAVRDASTLRAGEKLVTRVEKGRVVSTVERVEPGELGGSGESDESGGSGAAVGTGGAGGGEGRAGTGGTAKGAG
ncbi:MAG: exodeoxyribonuclease VII large subunit [Planctomycetes bacterium]|nr:exodeoxyribonuclease VII large subunit [Planctomycetota bacterium]